MQKCATCQFYDRRHPAAAAGGVAQSQQGLCRRMAPLLSPINPKTYFIEGVWPTVRDDDWCGEWRVVPRRSEVRAMEPSHVASTNPMQPIAAHVARIGAHVVGEPGRMPNGGLVPPVAIKPAPVVVTGGPPKATPSPPPDEP
jgi:hypothetical protein